MPYFTKEDVSGSESWELVEGDYYNTTADFIRMLSDVNKRTENCIGPLEVSGMAENHPAAVCGYNNGTTHLSVLFMFVFDRGTPYSEDELNTLFENHFRKRGLPLFGE